MAYELKVNTGAIKVPVLDESGEELGYIKFIPTDVDILKRYKAVEEHFRTLELPSDPTSDDMLALSDDIKEQFNILFNSDVSTGLFGKTSPLTPLEDGTLYFQSVVDGISDLLEQVAANREKKRAAIEEAVKDYDRPVETT